jgi:serine phosphatase RsbU (regulator of sigma subunit)/tetratricopeptide (TPR) repeat protein
VNLNRYWSILYFILLIGGNSTIQAQSSPEIDANVKAFKAIKDGKGRFTALFDYADKYFDNESYDTALYIFNFALESATAENAQKAIGSSSRKVGLCYAHTGKYGKSIPYLDRSIELFKNLGDKKWLRKAYQSKGFVEKKYNHLTKAMENFLEALRLAEEFKDYEIQTELMLAIGSIETETGSHEKAEKAYLNAVDLSIEHNYPNYLNSAYNNLGVHYKMNDEFDKCIEYFNKSRKVILERGDTLKSATVTINIALVFAEMGEFDKSKAELDAALSIQKQYNDRMGILNTLTSATYNYSQATNPSPGIEYGDQAIELAEEFKSFYHLRYIHEFLSIIYEKKNDPQNAFSHYKQMVAFQDSLDKDENKKVMAELETKYETEKKESEIKQLNLEQELNKKEIEAAKIEDEKKQHQLDKEKANSEKEKAQNRMLIGGLGFAFCLALVLFRSVRQKKKDNDIISQQKREVESQRDFANEQKSLAEDRQAQVEEKNKEILDSINYAKRIQTAILPPHKLVKEYLQKSFIMYEPKDIVAGDFYWLETTGSDTDNNGVQSNRILFAAADCTGHGVPGAMVSVVCNNGLNRSVREYNLTDPAQILDKTRDIVIAEFEKSEEEVKDGMDIALCSLEYINGENILKYAGANNPLWIIRNGASEVQEIKADKQPIGKFAEASPYTTHTIELFSGDTFYIFSDGFADQFGGPRGKKYKASNFKKLLLSIQKETMNAQKNLIIKAFQNWKNADGEEIEQLDDVCVIGVRI